MQSARALGIQIAAWALTSTLIEVRSAQDFRERSGRMDLMDPEATSTGAIFHLQTPLSTGLIGAGSKLA
jgi:hypothetical protein